MPLKSRFHASTQILLTWSAWRAAACMHAAASNADNKLLTWGVNDHKSLGRDTSWDGGLRDVDDNEDSDSEDGDLNPFEATPTAIPSGFLPRGAKIVQVAAGDSATFVLTEDGRVYGCGTFRDMNGIFGFSYDDRTRQAVEVQPTFTLIPELKDIKSIRAGADFALALDIDGHVFAWGVGKQHQLGRRIIERRRFESLVPARVELPKRRKMVSIHTGIDHAFAVDEDGDTWAWGLNNFAQTGISTNAGKGEASIAAPRKVPALAGKQMRMLSGGRHHSIGVTSAGECLVWGRTDGYQLGLDLTQLPIQDPNRVLTDDRGRPRILLQPTALPIPNCIFATAGTDHCIAIDLEGKAWSWGFNVNYQCGQGSSDDIEVAKIIDKKSVRDQKFYWAGAGGQYSMLAAYQSPKEDVNGST